VSRQPLTAHSPERGETKSHQIKNYKCPYSTLLLLEQKSAKKNCIYSWVLWKSRRDSDYIVVIVMFLLTQWCNHQGYLTTVAEFWHQKISIQLGQCVNLASPIHVACWEFSTYSVHTMCAHFKCTLCYKLLAALKLHALASYVNSKRLTSSRQEPCRISGDNKDEDHWRTCIVDLPIQWQER